MPVQVFIKKHVKEGHVQSAIGILEEFRNMAKKEPGYISGETLINHYDSRSITVVSTWRTIEDWVRWQSSEKRAANEEKIEAMLEVPTKYEIYDVGSPPKGTGSGAAVLQTDEVS